MLLRIKLLLTNMTSRGEGDARTDAEGTGRDRGCLEAGDVVSK